MVTSILALILAPLVSALITYLVMASALNRQREERTKDLVDKNKTTLILVETEDALEEAKVTIRALEENNKKVTSQRKSSEVRVGQITEQLAPFLEGFPYNPKKAHFLGNPIDFIIFEEDHVRFLEVKSGNSQLSKSQKKIKECIEKGLVTFETFRIKGE